MTIHWLDFEMNLTIFSGHHATTAAIISRAMFFSNVAWLLSFSASPKHPQSLMGLAMASHRVTSVMTAIRASVRRDTSRR